MRRPVASGLGTAYVVVALLTRRITLSVAPWLTASIVVSLRGSEGIGGARGRISTPRIVPPLRSMPRVVDRSSGVWASIADIIVGASFRTVAGRSGVCTMARVYRGGAIAIITPPVRISIAPSAIGGPLARIAMFVGRQSALAAAVAVEVRMRHRAATSGSCTPRAGAVRSHRQRTRNCVVAVGQLLQLVFLWKRTLGHTDSEWTFPIRRESGTDAAMWIRLLVLAATTLGDRAAPLLSALSSGSGSALCEHTTVAQASEYGGNEAREPWATSVEALVDGDNTTWWDSDCWS